MDKADSQSLVVGSSWLFLPLSLLPPEGGFTNAAGIPIRFKENEPKRINTRLSPHGAPSLRKFLRARD
jgi:hypothetical protein